VEERTEDWVLLLANQGSCQGTAVHGRAVLDLHRLVEILSLNKMDKYGGTKRTGVPVKTLKKLLKKAGLKVSGKKATLTRRAKKARLLKGGLGDLGIRKAFNNMVGETGVGANLNFKTQKEADEDAKNATTKILRPDTEPKGIKGLPAARLTTAQQKAKDENDAYQKQIATDNSINAAQKQAIKDETESRVTTTYEKPAPSSLYKGIRNVFTGLGKNKRSRRS
jgi:hypothetical protein